MTQKILIFDMDGVLLTPHGYHLALQASVRRIALFLGAPQIILNEDQIAKFEALNVTNEWDTIAIFTALILVEVWKVNPSIRLKGFPQNTEMIIRQPLNFSEFIDSFELADSLPGHAAFQKIIDDNPALNHSQRTHLREILFHCRDIYQSLTLPIHQEIVLGSKLFHETYQIEPILNCESSLLKFGQPLLNTEQAKRLRFWLSNANHCAGILTNRPSKAPDGFLSSPEAELGVNLLGFSDLPFLGSGILAWFAAVHCHLPSHVFLKPNPVHTLGLMQMCLGCTTKYALQTAVSVWRGEGDRSDWSVFNGARIMVFEDSAKGLQSAMEACDLLSHMGVSIELQLIGVATNPIKRQALVKYSDEIIEDINQIVWDDL